MVLAEWEFTGGLFWTIIVVFMFTAWLMVLFSIFGDLFRDHETSGVAKALWIIFLFIAPFLGVLIYLIARGHGMTERALKQQQAQEAQFKQYVQSTAGEGDPTTQIAKGKELLDSGAISQEEFDAIKKKALS
jgi:ABC-type multidrug transport system fused ATPase/permease subunit